MQMPQTALLWGKTPGKSSGYPTLGERKEREEWLLVLFASRSSPLCSSKCIVQYLFFLKVFVKGRLVFGLSQNRIFLLLASLGWMVGHFC